MLSDVAEFCYKCDDFYHPNDEGGLIWNDPEIGILWPITELGNDFGGESALIMSDKDRKWQGLREFKQEKIQETQGTQGAQRTITSTGKGTEA